MRILKSEKEEDVGVLQNFIYLSIVLIALYNTLFTLILSTSSEKDIRAAFEKLAITHSDINVNINISHFKPKILEAIDHLKGISHKRPDVDSIFDFITRATASNITKEALADIITDLVKQNIIINKKSINGRDSFRRNTLEVFSTTDETSDTHSTQLQNEKGHKDNNKPNSSLQQPAHSFIETDIHTLCSCQQLAPEISTDTTSLNTSLKYPQVYQLIFKLLSLLTI